MTYQDEEPDVYLIGEQHNMPSNADKHQQLIEESGADYVLMEALDDYEPGETEQELEQLSEYQTLADAQTTYSELGGGSLLSERPDTLLQRARRRKDQYTNNTDQEGAGGYIPDSGEELISTPVYELHPAVIDRIVDQIDRKITEEAKGLNSERTRELMKMRDEYASMQYRQDDSDPADTEDIYRLFDFLHRKQRDGDLHVAGCDDPDLKERLYEDNSVREEMQLNKAREDRMADRIESYRDEAEGPVVAIVGADHVLPTSRLVQRLEEDGVSYETIDLTRSRATYDPSELMEEGDIDWMTDEQAMLEAGFGVPAAVDYKVDDPQTGVVGLLEEKLGEYVSKLDRGGSGRTETEDDDLSEYVQIGEPPEE